MKPPIILAVDTSDIDIAEQWIVATSEYVSVYKLGLEFYLNFGSDGVERIMKNTGVEIFLDLKLHDIPHTVAGAARSVAHLKPKFLTVHASGSSEMVAAAARELPDTLVTAVTILTSLSEQDLFKIGFASPALESAVALATMAVAAGARAVVSSPLEVSAIRDAIGAAPTIITPGVRPLGSAGSDDQMRTLTPAQAISAGASFVVIGRPITQAFSQGADAMRAAAARIAEEIATVA